MRELLQAGGQHHAGHVEDDRREDDHLARKIRAERGARRGETRPDKAAEEIGKQPRFGAALREERGETEDRATEHRGEDFPRAAAEENRRRAGRGGAGHPSSGGGIGCRPLLQLEEASTRRLQRALVVGDVVEDPIREREALEIHAPLLHADHPHDGRAAVRRRDVHEESGRHRKHFRRVSLEAAHRADDGLEAMCRTPVRQEIAAEQEEIFDELSGREARLQQWRNEDACFGGGRGHEWIRDHTTSGAPRARDQPGGSERPMES